MAASRYPGALWKPLAPGNYTIGDVIRPPRGLVLHIAEGDSLEGIWSWQNGKHDVSSYFIVGKDGTVWQAVDLSHKAWTQGTGNTEWIGVENAGWHTGPLTDAQVSANAGILAWLYREWGVPLEATDDPRNGRGLGWHGMGGAAWGGHTGCPGAQIVAQRPEIIARARALVTPTPAPAPAVHSTEESMLITRGDASPATYRVRADRTGKVWIPNPAILSIDQTINGQLGFEKTVIVWAQAYMDTIPVIGPKPPGYAGA